MSDSKTMGVVGGDGRQVALAECLVSDGFAVYACGFDSVRFANGVKKAALEEVAERCGTVILPLPVTDDGKTLKMDYGNEKITLDDRFATLMCGKRVFGGMMERLYRTSKIWREIETDDYYTQEEFAVRNAVPTAEGALDIAMREYPATISGSRCLVAGFGRVGKVLARMLQGIGAKVSVSARRADDLAWIAACGYTPVLTAQIGKEGTFDLIFNTIPALIFTRRVLSALAGRPLIVDLASKPGGVDFAAAEKIGVRAILAPSLPGRVAPRTAGEIIRDTVCHMIGE
ncbi:MAG TPA: dipicolinate synthase subunit DpsA [Ruminococcaceae bacterium]|jgi:dipicolinate synthase subunit A|nr:dipicolinate synthase subunit DpsA [Oscillospiraceae bacterium]